jgi:hypothetical protein
MKIHIHSKNGLYEVLNYGTTYITIATKTENFSVSVRDFKAFAGGLWNNQTTKDEMNSFLAAVRPDEYKKQIELEDKILTLAARADRIKQEIALLPVEELFEEEIIEDDEDDHGYDAYLEECRLRELNRNVEEWNKLIAKEISEKDKVNDKLRSIARQVYKNTIDSSNIKISNNGIKFIIQENYKDNTFRFCWDPYGFVDNFHSSISDIHRDEYWNTINGGWLKVIDSNVILYSKSGDYGVYNNTMAIECAKKIFPNKNIHSFAGKEWDIELEEIFHDLPF